MTGAAFAFGFLALLIVSVYVGAAMSTGSWAPWRSEGRHRAE